MQRANELSRGLNSTTQTPDRLLLLARVAEANGEHTEAMRYLRSAREQADGGEAVSSSSQTLRQIDTMKDSLQEKTGSWSQGMVQMRGRD